MLQPYNVDTVISRCKDNHYSSLYMFKFLDYNEIIGSKERRNPFLISAKRQPTWDNDLILTKEVIPTIFCKGYTSVAIETPLWTAY